MEPNEQEVHAETDGARAGSTPNIVRWILAISLLLAIVLLSVTWITGALSMGDAGSEATAVDRQADAAGAGGDDTDSMVADRVDEIEDAPTDAAAQPGTVEN